MDTNATYNFLKANYEDVVDMVDDAINAIIVRTDQLFDEEELDDMMPTISIEMMLDGIISLITFRNDTLIREDVLRFFYAVFVEDFLRTNDHSIELIDSVYRIIANKLALELTD